LTTNENFLKNKIVISLDKINLLISKLYLKESPASAAVSKASSLLGKQNGDNKGTLHKEGVSGKDLVL
jgi:hypothetical protein